MEFSLLFFSGESDAQPEDRYHVYLESARFADQHGFSAIWTPERHFHSFGGLYPNPAVGAAALAMITQNIRLRAGSVVLPLHHIARVVEEWAMVDNLSKGRVELSFAPGWVPNDFLLAPENFGDRKTIMHERIEQVQALWRGEQLRMPGGNGDLAEVNLFPTPFQKDLPIWLTSRGTEETFRLAGEKGFGILTHLLGQSRQALAKKLAIYHQAHEQAGHGKGKVSLMLHTYLAQDLAQVRQRVQGPFCRYLKTSMGLLKSLFKGMDMDVELEKLSPQDIDALLAFSFERYFQTSGLFGTPASCLPLMRELAEMGVDEIACLIDFGISPDLTLQGLEQLDELKNQTQTTTPLQESRTS